MKKYINYFKELLNDKSFMIPLFIFLVLSFGFTITHMTVNIDTLSYDRYFYGYELIAQRRVGSVLLNKILNCFYYNPFFIDTTAIVVLAFASMMYCVLIKEVSNNKIKPICLTIFACFFTTYSIMPEIFTYSPIGLNIGLGYLFTAFALISIYEYSKSNKIKFLIFSTLFMLYPISTYESFASVYLVGIFIILILKYFYNKDNNTNFKYLFFYCLKSVIPLSISIIISYIISSILIKILGLSISHNAEKFISYTKGIPFGIKYLFNGLIENYLIPSLYYLPMTYLNLALLISIILGIYYNIKDKNIYVFLIFIALNVSTLSLSILQGRASPYRTCQSFALTISFIFLIVIDFIIKKYKKKNLIKFFTIFIGFLLIFYQSKDMHKWFYTNYLRYEEEKNLIVYIGNELNNNYSTNKPVVFLGRHKLSKNVKDVVYLRSDTLKGKIVNKIYSLKKNYTNNNSKYVKQITQTSINSYITWATYAFNEPATELIKFFNLLGFNITQATKEMQKEAKLYIQSNLYEKKNVIFIERDNYIIVLFNN